jgi:hypothetical protein
MTFVESFDARLCPRPKSTPVVSGSCKAIADMTPDELREHDTWIQRELDQLAWHHSADEYRSELMMWRHLIFLRMWGRTPRDGESLTDVLAKPAWQR